MVIGIIIVYQKAVSPFIIPSCRFTPTCSEYAIQALRKYPFPRAFCLALKRLLKCHPFHSGGSDPLP